MENIKVQDILRYDAASDKWQSAKDAQTASNGSFVKMKVGDGMYYGGGWYSLMQILPDNIIQVFCDRINGTTVRVLAVAQNDVASTLTIKGRLLGSPASYEYSYELKILKGTTSGYIDVSINYYLDMVTLQTALVNPSSDATYWYLTIFAN